MATVGDLLDSPETGWKRIEGDDSAYKYTGNWTINTRSSTIVYGAKVQFNFTGTKLRILGYIYKGGINNVSIKIDGETVTTANEYNSSIITTATSSILYERTNLADREHTVTVTHNQSNGTAYLYFNGIDIADNKSLLTFNYIKGALDFKSNTNNMNLGDYISCEYTATSGVLGTFANLGKASKAYIPSNASTGTPDGSFYFICAGYTSKGQLKLVADRTLQYGISWNYLNTIGVVSGSGVPIMIDGKQYVLRLLSGGQDGYNAATWTTDNEWDQILCKSTLGGKVTGDNTSVWNFVPSGGWELTSTTYTGHTSDRKIRQTISGTTSNSYMASSGTGCFRPVLIVDVIPLNLNLKEVNPLNIYKVPCDISVGINYTPATSTKSATICDFNADDVSKLNMISNGTRSSLDSSVVLDGKLSLSSSSTAPMINAKSIDTNVCWEAPLDLSKFKSVTKVEVL